MSNRLPRDIENEILVRVGVKSLLRFQCVCLSWKSLISSPSFISMHTQYRESVSSHLLHLRKYYEDRVTPHQLLHTDGSFIEGHELEYPCQIRSRDYRFIFDCKGLILFKTSIKHELDDRGFESLILWNPAIRIYISLPRPSIGLPSANYRVYHGFGFDHTSNDYKVLRMVYVNNKLFPPQVELYKLRTGAWERVRVAHDFPNVVPSTNTHAYVNGASHWIGLQKRDMGLMASGSYKRVVVLFHMRDEELRVMKLPDHLSRPTYMIAQIGVSGGLLSVMQHSRQQFNYLMGINIWLMKEYGVVESWTKQCIFQLSGIYGFRNNEKILGRKQGKPFLYDLNTHRFINLGIKVPGLIFPENTFNESLVLLNEATLQTCQTCLEKCQWCDSKKEREKKKEDMPNRRLSKAGRKKKGFSPARVTNN